MRILRIILVWTLFSICIQAGAYFFLDQKVQAVMSPSVNEETIVKLKAIIPGTNFKNVQTSYANDYLAYMENGTFKVFNLVQGKQVFEKELSSPKDKTSGVLAYQWLPDRNTIIYFYANKNIYKNQRIIELYSLELPESSDDTPPDDRFNKTIDNMLQGGKIEAVVFSTSSNLIFLTVKNNSTQQLMEIDVMKHVRTLNKSRETIDHMAASDRYGTLYINSKIDKTHQVVAISGTKRWIISKKSNDRILGVKDGIVYIGEVVDDKLVKIKTTTDHSDLIDKPDIITEWEGLIPIEDAHLLIGSKGQVVIYDNQIAYVISDGQMQEIEFEFEVGENYVSHENYVYPANYISQDGTAHIQLNEEGTYTLVELQPLKFKD